MSDKNLKYSVLYDYYAGMLKENQRVAVDLYYNQDFSFTEMSEEMNISRSGSYDTLKRAERKLDELEDKLALSKKMKSIYQNCEKINVLAGKLDAKNFTEIGEMIKSEVNAIIAEG